MHAQQQTFTELHSEIGGLHGLLRADMEATTEAFTVLGRSLREIETVVGEAWSGSRAYVQQLAEGRIEEMDQDVARLLNYANTDTGFAAQRGLWFNPPVLVQYESGDADVRHVNERVAEVPFVFRALASVPAGARVLDVGASESTVCLSLATLGYDVTAIDPRSNPLRHPNLRVVVGKVEELQADVSFAAVVCLSTIEHIGVAAYHQTADDRRADLEAMGKIRDLTEPGGVLVLTTSYGPSRVDDFSRNYDRAGLDELLDGWDVQERVFLARADERTWVTHSADEPPPESEREVVVMIRAKRTS